jgi:threonyl-tRNA synthetase
LLALYEGLALHPLYASQIAIEYWRMPQEAKVRDLLLNVRADEAHHSHVNHTASLCDQDSHNPFLGKELSVPKNFVDPPEGFKP